MAKTILIVDDSASLRQIIKITLSSAGYQIIDAENGQDALNKIEGQKINLVVSDVNMPVMDGITFITELKKLPQFKFTPVIMLTTESEQEIKEAGKAAGVRAWMVKPFKPAQMLSAVQKLIV